MWMRSRAQVSQMMIVLMIGILSPVIYSDDSPYPAEDRPSGKFFQQQRPEIQQEQRQKNQKQTSLPLRLEVVAILSDASNESLGLSKALSRALNSITSAQLSQLNELIPDSFPSSSSWQSSADLSSSSSRLSSDLTSNSSPHRNVTWRVRNFVIANYTAQKASLVPNRSNNSPRQSTRSDVFSNVTTTAPASNARSDGGGRGSGRNRGTKVTTKPEILNGTETPVKEEEPEGSFFSPNTMPILCEFLGRTKAVAIVNLIGDVGSERLLSLVSTSSALPLIGSAQYANPLQTLHKDQDDFYINLSTSVRHFARALGHMLIYCHWHSFAVLFDDSPSILSSQIIWEEELSLMKLGDPSLQDYSSSSSSSASNYSDYDYEHPMGSGMSNTLFESGDGDGLDDPILNPNFVTLRTKSSNAAFRALSELTKATQGVIVLLCSQRSLIQVFRAAQQLRMLNGDYVFILVGQYSQFEVIPDWIPSGVLALRSPRSAHVSKHTMKATGKLLASALISVKNQRISREALEEPVRPTPARPYASFAYPTNQDLGGKRGRQGIEESFVERKNRLNSLNRPAESRPPTSPQSFPPWKNSRRNFIQPSSPTTSNGDQSPYQHHLSGGVFSGLGSASDFMTKGMKPLHSQGNANEQSSDLSMTMSDDPSEHSKVNSTSRLSPKVEPTSQNYRQGYNLSRKSLIRDVLLEHPPVQGDQPLSGQLRLPQSTISTSKPYLDHHNNPGLMMKPANEETSDDDGAIQDESFKSPPKMVFTSATIIRPSRNRQNSPVTGNQRHYQGGGSASGTTKSILDLLDNPSNISCWREPPPAARKIVSVAVTREMRSQMEVLASSASMPGFAFDILNLVRRGKNSREWKKVGNASVETSEVHLETIRWPGGGIFGPGERPSKAYRVVTITAPPFVMEAEAEDNRTCVKGFPCLKVNTNNKDELALIFADFERGKPGAYQLACCDGLAIDLLSSVGRELKFEIDLYLVPDGYFGSRGVSGQWNGIMSALMTGAAHMSFAPISVTSLRASAVDFSTPYFFSGVGLLGMSRDRDVPLLAFLAPFSAQLWAAIFIALNMTAVVVALYEWFSPFGLNPWGRQRTKNFSMASALWVVWGRLFSHLVAFKAPKSWPNKFLINVWGGFSVIFVASYTANIAALFAGMFFEQAVDVHDRSLLTQRVAAVKHSATDFYIKRESPHLWEHIQRFPVHSFQQGVDMLKNGSLDLLIGDRPLLDYYRGTDDSCSLIDVSEHDNKIGDDTYAVAMARGFPLRETISSLVAKYIANGYMDYLQGKWYGQMACFRSPRSQVQGARALGVDAVAGMFIMLGVGMGVGLLILILELIVYKYALPYFRNQPRGTLWRSPNLMFFSQKLYRFINCVELVSPHHAAKELVNTLRHGQITSLFQKSVKRKEHEQRRRRKSKAQFFEMIQEIRRVQRHDRQQTQQPRKSSKEKCTGGDEDEPPIYSIQARLESNRQTPKVIRILGEHVEFEDQLLQPPSSHPQDYLSEDMQQSSRKTSRSSIFSSRKNSQSDPLSGSRGSLPRSPAVGPSPSTLGGFRLKSSKSEKHAKTKSNSKTITMSSAVVKSSGDKKPLKTILKRGSCPNSSNFPMGDFSPSSSMVAIGKKLASASSPTPSLAKLTKSMKHKKKRLTSESGGRDVNFSSADESNDESDISAQERAEILTVNLTSLSKNEVIDLWKSSETELKSQLAQALKVQEELLEKLRVLTESQSSKETLEQKKSSASLKHEEFQPP